MKITVFLLSLAFLPLNFLHADDENFEKRKAHILSEIDERNQKMQEHKACIQAATNNEGLKACREKMKDWHRGEKMERLENRKEKIENRIQKLEQKKP